MISVIIPCRNRVEQICMCLDSIYDSIQFAKKLYPLLECEVILINDHSDNNFTIMVSRAYKQLRIIDSDGYGPGYARNLGIQHSNGKYLFFTDSDCLVDRDWIVEGYRAFLETDAMVIQGIPWLFQKRDNVKLGLCEEKLYEIMFSKYIDGNLTVMTDSRNLLFSKNVLSILGDKLFSEVQEKATAESRVFGKKCNDNGIKIRYAPSVKVYHEDPQSIMAACSQKYRHGSGRVLIWEKYQDFSFLKKRYFDIPISKGIPAEYILPSHAAFLLGFYNNLNDISEKSKAYAFLRDVFLEYGKSLKECTELTEYLKND